MIPTISPIFSISFCFTKPVEYAIALGGVDIGKHIAAEADKAMPISMVEVPPISPNLSCIPLQIATKIGINKAAAAVLEIKLLRT